MSILLTSGGAKVLTRPGGKLPRKGAPAVAVLATFDGSPLSSAWDKYSTDNNVQTFGRTTAVAQSGAASIRSTCSALFTLTPSYDVYVDYQPWRPTGAPQGSRYTYEDASGYSTGTFNCLSFWVRGPTSYPPLPTDTQAPYGFPTLSVGTYTMALVAKGGGNQEGYGLHGYHSLMLPNTSGRWMKVQLYRPGGFRSGGMGSIPCAVCPVVSSNGVSFTPYERITCSPSGKVLLFGGEYGGNVYGLWSIPGTGQPSNGDTLTGQTSGATRTIGTVAQHDTNNTDIIGAWCGYDPRWVMQGGCHQDWYGEYPNSTYWDRVTRWYVAHMGVIERLRQLGWTDTTPSLLPCSAEWDTVQFESAQDDYTIFANVGGYFDTATSRVFLTWEHNLELRSACEVRYAYQDIRASSFEGATVLTTLTPAANSYKTCYTSVALAGTAGRNIWLAIKQAGRSGFTQIGPLPTV